jgi:carboxypeptidase Taq
LKQLQEYWKEIGILKSAGSLHYWDLETQMPSHGGVWRGEVLSYFAGKTHELSISDSYIKLLEENSHDQNAKEALKDAKKGKCLPKSFVEELTKSQTEAQIAWEKAKKAKDFSLFKNHLQKMIEMRKQYANYINPNLSTYDVLLDDFSPGLTQKDIDHVFGPMKEQLIQLVKSYKTAPIKTWTVPIDIQEKVCQKMIDWMGINKEQFILKKSTHPFSLSVHPTDVRITTRYNEKEPLGSILATIHELGHALYESNLPIESFGSPASEANGYDLHESQSRFWEVCLGHTREFFEFLHSTFKEVDPNSVKDLSAEDIYLMATEVGPSMIRVDADPVTYGLHIMIRYEMEKKIFNENANIDDLPKMWNELYTDYLGITPAHDGEGILQDSHWAGAAFGYFPSYLLGSMMAAQMYATLRSKNPHLHQNIRQGEMKETISWLKEEFHKHGRMKSSPAMMKDATGEILSERFWIELLKDRFIDKKY